MIEAIAAWIRELANDTLMVRRSDDKVVGGRLVLYTDKFARIPAKRKDSMPLDRLIQHLIQTPDLDVPITRDIVVAAIGTLHLTAGTGRQVRVIITTPERLASDKEEWLANSAEWKKNQTAELDNYYRAAGRLVIDSLPVFRPADYLTKNLQVQEIH